VADTQFGTFTIRSSVDGFASDLGSYTQSRTAGVTWSTTSPVVDLDSVVFEGLSSVEFRIYLTDATSGNDFYLRMDNVVLDGSVLVVPEPSVLSMGAVAAVVLILLRRRRQSV